MSEGCRLPVLRRNQDNEDEWREWRAGLGGEGRGLRERRERGGGGGRGLGAGPGEGRVLVGGSGKGGGAWEGGGCSGVWAGPGRGVACWRGWMGAVAYGRGLGEGGGVACGRGAGIDGEGVAWLEKLVGQWRVGGVWGCGRRGLLCVGGAYRRGRGLWAAGTAGARGGYRGCIGGGLWGCLRTRGGGECRGGVRTSQGGGGGEVSPEGGW